MTLVTTAGASDADSYAALADADAYFDGRGITAWPSDDDVKEAALRRATTYLDNQYREKWVGLRYLQTQALAWPRVDGYRERFRGRTELLLDRDGFELAVDAIPLQIQQACMELALLITQGTTVEPTLERGGAIKSKSESVGPISESTVWQDGAPAVDRYTVVEGLLRGLVTGSPGAMSGNVRLVRS